MIRFRIKDQLADLCNNLKLILPRSRTEFILLCIFFLIYSSFGIYISLFSSILDWENMWVDRYLSFDNPTIFHSGILGHGAHSYLIIFVKPLLIISSVLIEIMNNLKAKTVFISIVCAYLIASSIMYIYRYIRNVVGLKTVSTLLLSIFYGFFFTNLILSFTIETYTYTICIMAFTVTLYSSQLKEGKTPKMLTNLIIALSLGGITITNIIKGIIPIYFTESKFKVFISKTLIIGFVFFLMLIPIELRYKILDGMLSHYGDFAGENDYQLLHPFYKYVTDLFFGAPIFYSGNHVIRGIAEHLMSHLLIIPYFYYYIGQYIFIGILYSLVVISIIKNWKNKYIHMLLLLFCVDIIIHIILKYGVRDYIIFGGHWIYIIPLILAWLIQSIHNKSLKVGINIILGILTIILICNNVYHLIDFVKISTVIFPEN